MKNLDDDELIDYLKNKDDFSNDWKLVHEALARIVIGMKKKWVKCGGFMYWWNESFGMHNMIDEYANYTHLWKINDYAYRFTDEIINRPDEDEEDEWNNN